jgi:hypothetical protein
MYQEIYNVDQEHSYVELAIRMLPDYWITELDECLSPTC